MRVLISCGEASGDLYAGALAAELRVREPGIEIAGLGGPRLAAAGADLVGDFSALSITGMTGAVRLVPRSIGLIRRLTASVRARRPDAVVVIDAPDFHLPLLWALRNLGVPAIYYVSPQLWAWRRGRMASIKRRVARMLVLFRFEEAMYQAAGVPVEFVGHPLVDLARPSQTREAFLREHRLAPAAPTVALLPGSRRNELHRIAPAMAAALPAIRAAVPDVQFVIAAAPGLPDDLFAPFFGTPFVGPPEGGPYGGGLAGGGLDNSAVGAFRPPILVRERTDDVLHACDLAIAASGTATLQCALHEVPMVVVYRLSGLDYRMARQFVTLSDVAMPNVLAGRRIVPELIQDDFTPDRVAEVAVKLLTDPAAQATTRAALRDMRDQLGGPGASGRAAEAVLGVARRRAPL